jgi:hypothetical protein
MARGTFQARAATATLLLAIAGCGGRAAATPTPVVFGTSIASPTGNPTGNPSGHQWTGTVKSDSSRLYVPGIYKNPNPCQDTWAGTIGFRVDDKNMVTGSGQINLTNETCSNLVGPNTMNIAFSVIGSRDQAGFALELHATAFLPSGPQAGTLGGINSLFYGNICDPSSPAPAFSVGFSDQSHATGDKQISGMLVCAGSSRDVVTSQTKIAVHST